VSEVRVRACDVPGCGKIQGVADIVRYEIKVDGAQKIVTDLCDEHAEPLLEVVDKLPNSVRKGRKRRSFEDDMVDEDQE
jgi:hypothetical protein